MELGCDRVFQRVGDPAPAAAIVLGNQIAAHEREAVVDEAAIIAGDQRAACDGGGDQAKQQPGGERPPAGPGADAVEHGPDEEREDEERHAEMDGEPCRAHIGPVGEAALHHPPADQPLQRAERQQQSQAHTQPPVDPAPEPEPGERQDEEHAQQPPPEAVDILPPENRAEAVEVDGEIDLPELRRLPVEGENPLPLGLGQRRQPADQRAPFHHRQARPGEPRDAADRDHGGHGARHEDEPDGHGAARGRLSLGHGAPS